MISSDLHANTSNVRSSNMLFLVFIIAICIIEKSNGVSWRNCFGCCGRKKQERYISNLPILPSVSRMDGNQNNTQSERNKSRRKPVISGNDHQSKVSEDDDDDESVFEIPQNDKEKSCRSIINDIPRNTRPREHGVQDQQIRRCMRRWNELTDDRSRNPWKEQEPSNVHVDQSVTRNLVIFKLEETIVDTQLVSTESCPPRIISFYNKHNLVFNAVPRFYLERSWFSTKWVLAIYRHGLMELLYILKSGQITGNIFDIALLGDETLFDIVHHAVAIETFYNWHYIRSNTNKIRRELLTDRRLEELRINFKFATTARKMPEIPPNQYDRVFIVDSGVRSLKSHLLPWDSQIIGLKIPKFEIRSRDFELSLKSWFKVRTWNDEALARVQAYLVDVDYNAGPAHEADFVEPRKVFNLSLFSAWQQDTAQDHIGNISWVYIQ